MKKKSLLLLLILSAAVVLTGCSSDDDSSSANISEAQQANDKENDMQEIKYEKLPEEERKKVSNEENPIVVIETEFGNMEIELLMDKAPKTAANFKKLVEEGFYDGIKFHRVINGFMLQGGDPLTKDDSKMNMWGTGGPGYTIDDEFGEGLSNTRGTISMANSGPDTGGSQFFINQVDNSYLDNKHAVFGKLIRGYNVLDAIAGVQTTSPDRPIKAVVMKKLYLLEGN